MSIDCKNVGRNLDLYLEIRNDDLYHVMLPESESYDLIIIIWYQRYVPVNVLCPDSSEFKKCLQDNNPRQLADDEEGYDEEEDDWVAPLSEVGVALYGGVDPHVEKRQQGKGSQTQQYQSESYHVSPTLVLLSLCCSWPGQILIVENIVLIHPQLCDWNVTLRQVFLLIKIVLDLNKNK